jgi:predicted ATP-grasp superfamily ATP-dependent carboligase
MPSRPGPGARLPLRHLLAGDQTLATLSALRALQAAGHEVWLAHWQAETYATRSRAKAGAIRVPDPSLDPGGFVNALVLAARELRPATILPGGESSLIALAGREEEFPAEVVVGTFPPDLVRRATDKQALAEIAQAAGLATPPTHVLDRNELRDRAEKLRYPLVLKAARSLVSDPNGTLTRVETRRVDSSGDLITAIDSLQSSPVLVQQYIPGVLRTVCGVAWGGRLVCSLLQENTRLWPPGFGVASLAISLPRDPELEQVTARIVQALELSAVFQVEFLVDGDERYLIDLNPRIYSSMGAAIAAGLNLPAIWVELLLGGSPQVSGYRVGVRWRVEDSELRLLKRAVLRGDGRAVSELVLPRRGTAHAAFMLRDPGPAFITVRRLLRTLRINAQRLVRRPGTGVG